MNGIHDMGGMHGFGAILRDDTLWHHEWEKRVHAIMRAVGKRTLYSLDAFRHSIERLDPSDYLRSPYHRRWRKAIEALLVERGVLTREELEERYQAVSRGEPIEPVPSTDLSRYRTYDYRMGFREATGPPRFAEGDWVRTRNINPPGHTRLPRYVRDKVGTVRRVYGVMALPDTRAHDRGENPEFLYRVSFPGEVLWGPDADIPSSVYIDLFESYLEPAPGQKNAKGDKA